MPSGKGGPQPGTQLDTQASAGRLMRVWRAIGYDGRSLIVIPGALLAYWWSGERNHAPMTGLGVWFIFVVAWLYARLRQGRSEQ
jgi:hypothetical protein